MNDKLSKLWPEDRAKFDALVKDWERDGKRAIRRLREADPLAYLHIVAAFHPRVVGEDLERDALDNGLAHADLRAMAKPATRH